MDAYQAIMTVNRIFKSKQWVQKDTQELAFNGFCNLFSSLENHQIDLLLELTTNYHWITQPEYQDKLIEAMEAISQYELVGVQKIYFFPIIKPEDEEKAKSGEHLFYIIKSNRHLLTKYTKIKFDFVKTFERLEGINLKADERLYLVDDYVGSGQTFNYCMSEVAKNKTLTSNLIKIICIAIQEETKNNLMSNGFAILTTLTLRKGITDFNNSPDIEQKKDLMRDIERYVPGSKPFSLGYDETEALITLARTPDNTFPVFWKKFKKAGKSFDAPFARFEES